MILLETVFGKIYRGFKLIIEGILLIELYETIYRINTPRLSAIILSLMVKPLKKKGNTGFFVSGVQYFIQLSRL